MDVVVSHVNADFDSLGGLVGAGRLYPGAALVLPGGESQGVRDFLALHRAALEVRTPADIDPSTITRVIVVDTCSRRRVGKAAEWLDLPEVEVHVFDHHPTAGTDLKPAFQRVETWGAVSSILAEELRSRGETPIPIEATAMLLGIYEDTGSLSFAGTTPHDLEAAAWLLKCGAQLDVVAEFTRRTLNPAQRELLHQLVENLELHEVGGVQVTLASAAPEGYVEDAALLAHRVLEVEDSAVAVLLLEMQGVLYVISRGRSDAINLGEAMRELGGGGHARAASAKLKGETAEALKPRLLKALERHVTPERTAREIMSYPVRTVSPDGTVAEARRRMIRYGHSGLLVMDAGKLAGVITRRDVDKARHHRLVHAPVQGFMTRDVCTVRPDTPLSDLEELIIQHNIGRLPVVRGDEVLGIVTRTDVLRALHGGRYLTGARQPVEETALELLRERLPAPVQRLLEQVGEVAAREGERAYVVGGFVRDLFLQVKNLDLDILVEATRPPTHPHTHTPTHPHTEPEGIALARIFAGEAGGELKVIDRFATAKVRLPEGWELDFATARTESYERPGALPEVEASSVTDDLRRRDFTFNAMAVALAPKQFGHLLDPFGGRDDLDRRRVRVLHNLSFVEDPTRIFRAVRFEARYHFRMDAHTETLARTAIKDGALASITPERLRQELYHIFREANPLGSLTRLEELGMLSWLHPELRLDEPLIQAVQSAVQWWREKGRDPLNPRLVFLAALLYPLGSETALTVAETRLRIPPPGLAAIEAAYSAAASIGDLLPPSGDPAIVTARLKPLSAEGLTFLRSVSGPPVRLDDSARETLEQFVTTWRHTKLEITGEDLKALGYPPGPAMGEALRRTLDARLKGEVNGRASELEYARRLLDQTTQK